jgi:hypothetical protein
MIGNPQEKISLDLTNNQIINRILELLMAFGAGMLAYALHGIMKNPIGVPGHHGLIFMGIMMATRLTSGNSGAGTAASIGVGSIILFGPMGFSDPLRIITYMLPGITLDMLFLLVHQHRGLSRQILLSAIFGGAAYMTIPLLRIALWGVAGLPYPAITKYGVAIPLISFFLFGLAGGLSGKLINRLIKLLNHK